MPTPPDTRRRWTFVIDRFGRSDRDLPPQVVDGMFEDVIAECLEDVPEPSVVLATDGSVVPNIPKSGWGYVIRDSCGNLRVGHGGCKMLLSSMRAEIEAVSRGLNLMREVAPDTADIIICTDSQALLRRLASGVSPPEWHGTSEKIIWVYCPGHVGVKLNERADHLAGSGPTTDCIMLDTRDISSIMGDAQRRRRRDDTVSREEKRMLELGLPRGWVATSLARGRDAQLRCQLASGTIARAALYRVLQMGGCRGRMEPSARPPPAHEASDTAVSSK